MRIRRDVAIDCVPVVLGCVLVVVLRLFSFHGCVFVVFFGAWGFDYDARLAITGGVPIDQVLNSDFDLPQPGRASAGAVSASAPTLVPPVNP